MISVCIATYNGEGLIKTQLESILPQLGVDDEIIISDDHSTDHTREQVLSFNDSRIVLVDGPALGSPIPNFENALRHAKGDYIFFSDQDDKWMPGKLETCLSKLQEGHDCVVTDCIMTDNEWNVTASSFFVHNHTHEGKFFNLFLRNGYLGGCMAFSKRLKNKALPFPEKLPMHDIWLGNLAAFYYDVIFIHKPCSYFRRNDKNVTDTGGTSKYSLYEKFMFRWRMISFLWKRRK